MLWKADTSASCGSRRSILNKSWQIPLVLSLTLRQKAWKSCLPVSHWNKSYCASGEESKISHSTPQHQTYFLPEMSATGAGGRRRCTVHPEMSHRMWKPLTHRRSVAGRYAHLLYPTKDTSVAVCWTEGAPSPTPCRSVRTPWVWAHAVGKDTPAAHHNFGFFYSLSRKWISLLRLQFIWQSNIHKNKQHNISDTWLR